MSFEKEHQLFIDRHLSLRTGERKGRLERGHQFAEKQLLKNVWWPLYGNLDYLHPEYEIFDWNLKSQFLDFAVLPPFGRICMESDGYQSHVIEMDRTKFSYSLNRDTFLTGLGWRVVHFSFDDIQNRPDICRSLLQMIVNPYLIRSQTMSPTKIIEKEIMRYAWCLGRPVRPVDITNYLDIDFRTARKWLRSLVEKGWMNPLGNTRDVRYYELKQGTFELLI